jgi:hypothetical protein
MGFQITEIGKKLITVEDDLFEIIFTYPKRDDRETDFTEIKKMFNIDRVFKSNEEYVFLRKVEEAKIEDDEQTKLDPV